MTDNMELWNSVCRTDPKQTRKVDIGRGFTAIDAIYQIRNATEQFGPAGETWGWEVKRVDFLQNDTVAVLVRLWTNAGAREFGGIEQWGQCGIYTNKNKTNDDQDCMKKATTDGITKCLSYLGFNADVFMGKFGDNKYVAQMNKEFADQQDVMPKPEFDDLYTDIEASENKEELNAALAVARTENHRMSGYMREKIKKVKAELETKFANREMDNDYANKVGQA